MKTRLQRAKAKPLAAADEARFGKFSSGLAKLSTQELVARARPMTPEESARWQAARGGRPKKPPGQKAARVLLIIDPKLLEEADRYARSHGMTRAQLITTGLRTILSA